MEIFGNVEIEVRIKCCLSRKFAFSVFAVPIFVPHGIATIKIITYVVRDVCNDKLCFWYSIPFKILEIIVV